MSTLRADPQVIESYRQALKQHGPKPAALGWTKEMKIEERHDALSYWDPQGCPEILDYGCGLGHLIESLAIHHDFYTGVDVVPELLTAARRRFPKHTFLDIDTPYDLGTREWDHIVCCGIFTRMGDRSENDHIAHIRATLSELFTRCRGALHVDFLDAMMIDQPKLGEFAAAPWDVLAMARGLSPRVSIDCSYLPYEFCVHIFKSAEIERPANVYRWGGK